MVPVTYMNSSAALKAFCGRHGGIVCTSSNAATVLEWAFARGQRVLFFPISWREEDQVSNNKLTSFGISLLKLCGKYLAGPKAFVEREWRDNIIENYSYEVVASNL